MQANLKATWNNEPIVVEPAFIGYWASMKSQYDGCWCADCRCLKTTGTGENPNQAICDLIERLMEKQ